MSVLAAISVVVGWDRQKASDAGQGRRIVNGWR